jgi:KUP system potassium uptake protein
VSSDATIALPDLNALVVRRRQRLGTGGIGKIFGPVMAVWFTTLAGLGVYHIAQRPEILAALSPHHAGSARRAGRVSERNGQ